MLYQIQIKENYMINMEKKVYKMSMHMPEVLEGYLIYLIFYKDNKDLGGLNKGKRPLCKKVVHN